MDKYNIEDTIKFVKPDIIINCIGLIKQKSKDGDKFIKINSSSIWRTQDY